jgi:hypothetical protein
MGIETEYPGSNGRLKDREKERKMLRKTILGAAAALTLGLTAIAPTTASASGFSVHFGGGGFGYHDHGYGGYGYGYGGCFKKKVKVFDPYYGWVWTKKNICY